MPAIINKNIDKIQLHSFDIFDTLVTRTVAQPTGIFAIMQEILLREPKYQAIPNFIKQNFYTIRSEAESYTRINYYETKGKNEISFSDIYANIKHNHNLPDESINTLMELEISTEIKNLLPIKKNLNLLKDLINSGKKVVLISDMYHTKEVLQRILTHIDPIFADIKIFVSSEYNQTKHHGNIYDIVKKEIGIEPKFWKHYGDNKHADIRQAQRKSIKTKWFPQEKFLK